MRSVRFAIMKAMQIILPLICFAAGLAVAWALLRPRLAVLAERGAVPDLDGRVATLAAREAELMARLEAERQSAAEKLTVLDQSSQALRDHSAGFPPMPSRATIRRLARGTSTNAMRRGAAPLRLRLGNAGYMDIDWQAGQTAGG